jgi:hypothetical protein
VFGETSSGARRDLVAERVTFGEIDDTPADYWKNKAARELGWGLPDTEVGTFTQALYDEAKKGRRVRLQHEE